MVVFTRVIIDNAPLTAVHLIVSYLEESSSSNTQNPREDIRGDIFR